MDRESIERFVNSWASAWNTHDVEAVLAHFAEDVVFSSPVAARVLGSDGVVRGKDALRAYWTEALTLVPDLRFEVLGCYAGVDCLVVHYRNQVGGLVNEVLVFDGPLVVRGYGTYLSGDRSAPAGIG
ncbi:nuclear transport factor 2 family protein [Streptacidiphilus anmyonensis]|uniref:nuclear transport factor 2 family protein n=1 Tax=Streptacidiphilus anmyonensis TaxID=405782 RepID=UPI0005AA3CA5|nr:nuclear transport factor 2 family protein [Streptacidiphilus anmyonensis]